MRTRFLLALFSLSLCLSMNSCLVLREHPGQRKEIPPGQIKRIHKRKAHKVTRPPAPPPKPKPKPPQKDPHWD